MWLGRCSSPFLHPTELPANPHRTKGSGAPQAVLPTSPGSPPAGRLAPLALV